MSPDSPRSKVTPVTRADTKAATTVTDDKPVQVHPRGNPSRLRRALKRLCCFRPASAPARKTLVLDLDETIVFADLNIHSTSGFTVPAVFQGVKVKIFVSVRPGWTEFLRKASKHFDVVFFTAAERNYADAILDHIDRKRVAHRLYREHCGYYLGTRVKDLARLGRDLRSVIIVDDLPDNYRLQQENGITVPPFRGQEEDTVLRDLLPLLMELKDAEDVRTVLAKLKAPRTPTIAFA